eukprot:CAMPEP_0194168794 /NCGR_PEP_ID=MMETSP0154-20130528/3613_1 /TAXON_ID=1049557 /ORGANISM="Thalassiothrix antarctica, Strain L6-D1" /LENGTH=415 /DNA_ID=CAMNT_0038879985 /DNA_START=78 /DNA_END=1325 /DNA_ORIENTATION=+
MDSANTQFQVALESPRKESDDIFDINYSQDSENSPNSTVAFPHENSDYFHNTLNKPLSDSSSEKSSFEIRREKFLQEKVLLLFNNVIEGENQLTEAINKENIKIEKEKDSLDIRREKIAHGKALFLLDTTVASEEKCNEVSQLKHDQVIYQNPTATVSPNSQEKDSLDIRPKKKSLDVRREKIANAKAVSLLNDTVRGGNLAKNPFDDSSNSLTRLSNVPPQGCNVENLFDQFNVADNSHQTSSKNGSCFAPKKSSLDIRREKEANLRAQILMQNAVGDNVTEIKTTNLTVGLTAGMIQKQKIVSIGDGAGKERLASSTREPQKLEERVKRSATKKNGLDIRREKVANAKALTIMKDAVQRQRIIPEKRSNNHKGTPDGGELSDCKRQLDFNREKHAQKKALGLLKAHAWCPELC